MRPTRQKDWQIERSQLPLDSSGSAHHSKTADGRLARLSSLWAAFESIKANYSISVDKVYEISSFYKGAYVGQV
jgi:hypothetical protein